MLSDQLMTLHSLQYLAKNTDNYIGVILLPHAQTSEIKNTNGREETCLGITETDHVSSTLPIYYPARQILASH